MSYDCKACGSKDFDANLLKLVMRVSDLIGDYRDSARHVINETCTFSHDQEISELEEEIVAIKAEFKEILGAICPGPLKDLKKAIDGVFGEEK